MKGNYCSYNYSSIKMETHSYRLCEADYLINFTRILMLSMSTVQLLIDICNFEVLSIPDADIDIDIEFQFIMFPLRPIKMAV